MKKLITVLILTTFILGCGSTKTVDMPLVMSEAMSIAQDSHLNLVNIPSNGSIGDAASIAFDGGIAADKLRQSIELIHRNGGGNLVVTSVNPELPNAHIKGALRDLNIEIENVLLIYAGKKEYSDLIKEQVEAKGIKYGFVDTYQ